MLFFVSLWVDSFHFLNVNITPHKNLTSLFAPQIMNWKWKTVLSFPFEPGSFLGAAADRYQARRNNPPWRFSPGGARGLTQEIAGLKGLLTIGFA